MTYTIDLESICSNCDKPTYVAKLNRRGRTNKSLLLLPTRPSMDKYSIDMFGLFGQ